MVQAQRAVRGVAAQDLRDSKSIRQEVATQLTRVQTSLDAMLIDRPRRRILRNAPQAGGLMDLVISPDGTVRAIYAEDINLRTSAPPSSAGPVMSNLTPRDGGSPI